MARYSAGATSTNAGTSARPIGSLFAIASVSGTIREVGIFNTTDVSCVMKLVRLTAAGTPGTGLTEAKHNDRAVTASMTAFNSHSADATVGDDLGYRVVLGAAKGSGVVWTFGDTGILIPSGTANGVGILPVGTGQVCEFYFVWDE